MEERVKNKEVSKAPNKIKQELQNPSYKLLVQSFKSWLSTLGYSESTVYKVPRQLKEFLFWLESKACMDISKVTTDQVKDYIDYFKNRPNKRKSGGVSFAHVNGQIDTLSKLSKYLKEVRGVVLKVEVKYLKSQSVNEPEVLTKDEIKQLYMATDISLIGTRDRVMLGVYYGCGLRKKEGVELELDDVLFDKQLLYVRKTKNRCERYVPITTSVLQDLEAYIYHVRPLLIDESVNTHSLFINDQGLKVKGAAFVGRLKTLQEKTGNPQLQCRSFGLHALRHSIATHLLQAGMELENIALFLGHKTLESTQVYTHLHVN
jgi:integrase/recombinase XerD